MNICYQLVEINDYSVQLDLGQQGVLEDEPFLEFKQGYLIYLALPKNCGIYQPLKNDTGASGIYKPGIDLSWCWNVMQLSSCWNVMHE